jgi:trk system potassium uptake protein TrkA
MKQFAIIGVSYFGKNVLEELLALDVEVLLIDKDREVIDGFQDLPVTGIVMDVLNQESLRQALPPHIDAVVIDLGEKIEASILATSYCHKLGIKTIIVKAETEGHAEILELVGATRIVFPNKEAAKRVTPLLLSSALLNYLPVGGNLVIAEISLPAWLDGKTLIEADLRRAFGINLIAVKSGEDSDYRMVGPDYRFQSVDIGLVSGSELEVAKFADRSADAEKKPGLIANIARLFRADK